MDKAFTQLTVIPLVGQAQKMMSHLAAAKADRRSCANRLIDRATHHSSLNAGNKHLSLPTTQHLSRSTHLESRAFYSPAVKISTRRRYLACKQGASSIMPVRQCAVTPPHPESADPP